MHLPARAAAQSPAVSTIQMHSINMKMQEGSDIHASARLCSSTEPCGEYNSNAFDKYEDVRRISHTCIYMPVQQHRALR